MTIRLTIPTILLLLGIQVSAQNEPLVPYRSGKVWGLADTNMRIVVKPQYDSIVSSNDGPMGYYRVKQNGKYGVITTDSVIIPPKLNSIDYRYDFIADVMTLEGTPHRYCAVYYNHSGGRILDDTIAYLRKHYSRHNYNLFMVKNIDGKKSMMLYDGIEQKITNWIYKNKSYHYIYSKTVDKKLTIFCENYSKLEDVYTIWTDSVGQLQSHKVGEAEFGKMVEQNDVEEEYEMADYLEEDVDGNSSVAKKIKFDIVGNDYRIISEGVKHRYYWRSSRHTKTDTLTSGSIPSKTFRLRSYCTFTDSVTNNYYYRNYPKNYGGGMVQSNTYIEYTKKKKIGFISESVTIAPQYDTIYGIAAQSGKEPQFIVGNRQSKKKPVLFGLLSHLGDTVIPLIYPKLEPYVKFGSGKSMYINGFIATNVEGEMSFINTKGEVIVDGYDSIIPFKHQSMGIILIKDGLYGFQNYRHFIEPIYNDVPLGFHYFIQFKVVELYDREFNFKGYGKLNGEVFYTE